jgi:hypothetical protein
MPLLVEFTRIALARILDTDYARGEEVLLVTGLRNERAAGWHSAAKAQLQL